MNPKDYAQAFLEEWMAGEFKKHPERVNTRKLVEKYIQQAVDAERKLMPCGHPKACVIWVRDEMQAIPFEDVDTTNYCKVCEAEARFREAAEALLLFCKPLLDEGIPVDAALLRGELKLVQDEMRRPTHVAPR